MLRSGALIRLADLRVLQGRFEEAEQLLEGSSTGRKLRARSRRSTSVAAKHGLAADVLERALEQMDP